MGHHLKSTWKLAYPVSINQLSHILVGVVDVIMVGRLGAIPLAAGSLGNSLFSVVLVFAIGFSYGLTPMVAQNHGAGRIGEMGKLLYHSLFLNLTLAVVILLVCLVGAMYIPMLNQPPEVEVLIAPYFIVLAISIIPVMVFQSFKQLMEGYSRPRPAMVISIAANLVNVGLNYVLIYGEWGFPQLGLLGAGIATLIARVLMAVGLFLYLRYHNDFRHIWSKGWFEKPSLPIIRSLGSLGLPISLQLLFEVGAFASATVMMGWISTQSIAAHQIAINLASISYMLASGLSSAATVRVGFEIGRKDSEHMQKAGYAALIMVFIFMGSCALIFILTKNFLPSLYIHDPTVEKLASSLLFIAGLFQLSDGLQVVCLGALRGMKDVKIPTFITLVAYWVLALPLGYVFGFWLGWGAEGIWYGLLLGLSVSAVFLLWRFRKLSRQWVLQQVSEDRARAVNNLIQV
jgi:multidrug resistance protein, MATE family